MFWETAYCPRPRAFSVYIVGPNFLYVELSRRLLLQVKLNFFYLQELEFTLLEIISLCLTNLSDIKKLHGY